MSPSPNTTPSYGQKAGALIFSGTIATAAGGLSPAMPSVKPEIERPADYRLYSGHPFPNPVPIAEGVKSGQTYSAMTEPLTRALLDAKLETIETKMDGRLARIEDRFSGLERRFDKLETILEKQKYTAWAAAGATIIAVAGVVFAAYSMGFGAFASGKEAGAALEQARTQGVATQQLLEEIRRERQIAQ